MRQIIYILTVSSVVQGYLEGYLEGLRSYIIFLKLTPHQQKKMPYMIHLRVTWFFGIEFVDYSWKMQQLWWQVPRRPFHGCLRKLNCRKNQPSTIYNKNKETTFYQINQIEMSFEYNLVNKPVSTLIICLIKLQATITTGRANEKPIQTSIGLAFNIISLLKPKTSKC